MTFKTKWPVGIVGACVPDRGRRAACDGARRTARARGREARAFATPEEAVKALLEAAKASDLDGLIALFGSKGGELISSSDAATARRNRDVFVVAMGEGWRLVNRAPDRKELVVGNEAWPFPVPLVKTGTDGASTPPPAPKRCCSGASGATSSPPSASAGRT